MRINHRLALVAMLLALFAISASASPLCTSQTWTYYQLQTGSGCQMGDFIFSAFGSMNASTSGSSIHNYTSGENDTLAQNILVNFSLVANLDGTNTASMVFTPNTQNYLSATGGGPATSAGYQSSLDLRPSFNLSVSSGPANAVIGSAAEAFTGRASANKPTTTPGGTSAVTYRGQLWPIETQQTTGPTLSLEPQQSATINLAAYDSNGCFYGNGPGGCTELSGTLQNLSSGTGFQNFSAPGSTVVVTKDILIKSGRDSNNFVALDSLTEQWTETFTPEPGQMALTGGALMLLGWVLRRKMNGAVKPN
jgi:hypothetical protein